MNNIYCTMLSYFREGESSLLIRSSRWEIAFALMKEVPFGFRKLPYLNSLERNGMKQIVTSREQELGTTETGQQALGVSRQKTL
ncbi:MAG: hypothetical protein ACOX5R_21710 [bacterium]|jgi:hypothetical protein